jgi:hypothetical protein
MGYAMLHEYGADTETRFFTPTGPFFPWFCSNGLPFAVCCAFGPLRSGEVSTTWI